MKQVEYRKEELMPSLPPHYTISMWKKTDDSPWTDRRQVCLVTTDTRASVTIARPDITGLSKRNLPSWCILQMATGDLLHLE
jgi:hypothetical protein